MSVWYRHLEARRLLVLATASRWLLSQLPYQSKLFASSAAEVFAGILTLATGDRCSLSSKQLPQKQRQWQQPHKQSKKKQQEHQQR